MFQPEFEMAPGETQIWAIGNFHPMAYARMVLRETATGRLCKLAMYFHTNYFKYFKISFIESKISKLLVLMVSLHQRLHAPTMTLTSTIAVNLFGNLLNVTLLL